MNLYNRFTVEIKKIIPHYIYSKLVAIKSYITRKKLFIQKSQKRIYYKEKLVADLRKIGVNQGDVLMVHCKMSSIGYINNGPYDIIGSLLETIKCPLEGTLLMPSFPFTGSTDEYFKSNSTFDVARTPSMMGKVSEVFRQMEGVKRSLHPSHPVISYGKMSDYLLSGHFKQKFPFNENSPFYKLSKVDGKILLIGLSIGQALTNLHVIEDIIKDFRYPVYYKSIKTNIIDYNEISHNVELFIHDPLYSKQRKCDELMYIFEEGVDYNKGKIGDAECLLFFADKLQEKLLSFYYKNITIYNPNGNEL